jgi:hypothetical protein
MANVFGEFLSNVGKGILDPGGYLKDYKHATRLYTDSKYGMAPKAGWSYFVEIGLNPKIATEHDTMFPFVDKQWYDITKGKLGLTAKTVDLPRFSIDTETLNQYNKKTIIQTKIKYTPISMTFHDDNDNMSTNFWKNYFKYYYADGNWTGDQTGKLSARSMTLPEPYIKTDNHQTLFPAKAYSHGLNNGQSEPFITYITVYLLNRQKYSPITFINPMITEFSQSQLDNTTSKFLENKMTFAYETVYYGELAKISKERPGFNSFYYDNAKSPNSAFGRGAKGLGGLLAGANDVLGILDKDGPLSAADYISLAVGAKNIVTNAKSMTKGDFNNEVYSMALGGFAAAAKGDANTGGTPGAVDQVLNRPAGVNMFDSNTSASTSPTYTGETVNLTETRTINQTNNNNFNYGSHNQTQPRKIS